MGDGAKQAQSNANGRWGGQARARRLPVAAAGGMILAAVLAGSWSLRSVSEKAADRIARTGVVRIGYAVEPPFALVGASRAG